MSAVPSIKLAAKQCTKCGETKAISEFTRNKTCRDGVRPECKVCRGAYRRALWAGSSRKSRETVQAKNKAWQAANPERHQEYVQQWRDRNVARMLWLHAKRRAIKRGLKFDITIDDLSIPVFCPVLGIRLARVRRSEGRGGPGPSSPTVDRIDASKGYVRGNVAVISHKANRLKSNATVEELEAVLAWLRKVSG